MTSRALLSAWPTRRSSITGAAIRPGDVLIGFPSTGLHTNGYSLARKLFFEVARYTPNQYVNALKEKAGAALMKVHRSYLPVIKKLTAGRVGRGHGAYHREAALRRTCRAFCPKASPPWSKPAPGRRCPSSSICGSWAALEPEEMLRTFNMGIGLIAVIPADKFKRAKTMLDRAQEKFCVIGRTVKGERKVIYA